MFQRPWGEGSAGPEGRGVSDTCLLVTGMMRRISSSVQNGWVGPLRGGSCEMGEEGATALPM